jgi:cytochrome b561
MLKNTADQFGLISKALHWFSAFAILGLFALGYWMVDLDYYSDWYQTAPHWHESIGVLLLLMTFIRVLWRLMSITPKAIISHSTITKRFSLMAHFALYLLLFLIMFSGYLIPTADGRDIAVFTWFELPALGELFSEQEDISGTLHEYGAYAIIVLSLLHALAALKHHFIDKDATLVRMLKS